MKSLIVLAVIGVCSASYQANSVAHHGPAHGRSHAVVHTSVSHGGPSYGNGGSSISHGGSSISHGGSSISHGGSSYGHGGSSISHGGFSISHGGPSYGDYAPYVGPLASSVPAGIGGHVIPVSDTYEVAAARDAFFKAYDNQLATINAIRYNRAGSYGGSYGSGGSGASIHGAVHGSFNGPTQVRGAGHAVSYSHGGPSASYGGPVASYSGPAASYGGSGYSNLSPEYFAPTRDTPEVAAAKAEFFKAYDRQAAAAAAAPDNYVHH